MGPRRNGIGRPTPAERDAQRAVHDRTMATAPSSSRNPSPHRTATSRDNFLIRLTPHGSRPGLDAGTALRLPGRPSRGLWHEERLRWPSSCARSEVHGKQTIRLEVREMDYRGSQNLPLSCLRSRRSESRVMLKVAQHPSRHQRCLLMFYAFPSHLLAGEKVLLARSTAFSTIFFLAFPV